MENLLGNLKISEYFDGNGNVEILNYKFDKKEINKLIIYFETNHGDEIGIDLFQLLLGVKIKLPKIWKSIDG